MSHQLLLVLVLVLITVSVVFLAMIISVYKKQLIAERGRASLEVSHLLRASLENAMLNRDIAGLNNIVLQLGNQEAIGGVMILNPDREVRFSSDSSSLGKFLDNVQVDDAIARREPQTAFVTDDSGNEWLRSVNPVLNRQECKQCHGASEENPINGLLVVDYKAKSIRSEAMRAVVFLGLIGALVILAAGCGIWLALNKLVLNRMSALEQASMRLSAGALDTRADVKGDDEIGGFGKTFNQMATQLQNSFEHVVATEQFLQSVIDTIPDGIRVISDDFDIVMVNAAYCRLVGKSSDDVVGAKCFASSHSRTQPCLETLITCPLVELRRNRPASIKVLDTFVIEESGDLFVEVSAARVTLVKGGKKVDCIVESIRDLTQEVEYSQQQRLSEIGLLATGVAHEIHNPLSSIELALTAIAETREGDSQGAKFNEYIDIVRSEIDKCLSVTDGLMRLSELPRDKEPIFLGRVIRGVISLLEYQLQNENIRADIDVDEGLRVIANDNDIRMLTINLAQNAIHAMPDGGDLRIVATYDNDNIALKFSDTGVGISQEHLLKIFLPFWTKRADRSHGRGIGLSICKAIVVSLGGNISVASKIGDGTTFTVELPNAG